jgi:cytidylate kinase
MAVITISREFGSEGNYIGPKVAQALGYRIVFKDHLKQIFEHFGVVDFEVLHQPRPNFWSGYHEARDEALEFMIAVVRAVASVGNVVLMGRCSGAILRACNDVLNVRIQAPFDIRVARIRRERLADGVDVARLVQDKDQEQARLFENFRCCQWDKAETFDLVINTGKLSPDLAVRIIVEAVRHLERHAPFPDPTAAAIDGEPAIQQAVNALFQTLELSG